MIPDPEESALRLIAWSRVWSPLAPEPARQAAWAALELPESYASRRESLWNLFQVGNPMPPISLLLHAALGREGAGVREDWLRVIGHLDLQWSDATLPPDHLGPDCEIYACAIEQGEPVLVEELRARYLLPWCDAARARLESLDPSFAWLVEGFARDLARAAAREIPERLHAVGGD